MPLRTYAMGRQANGLAGSGLVRTQVLYWSITGLGAEYAHVMTIKSAPHDGDAVSIPVLWSVSAALMLDASGLHRSTAWS